MTAVLSENAAVRVNYIVLRIVSVARRRWVKMVYNQNWCDPSLYDMCVNLQNMSMENICDVVAMVIEHEDFRSSENTMKRLNNAALQCDVEAALTSDDKIWNSGHQVSVTARDGMVSLKGTVKTEKLKDLIEDTASRVNDVAGCKSVIRVLSVR